MSDDMSTGLIIGLIVGIPLGLIILSLLTRPAAQSSIPAPEPQTTYTNKESWEIVQDERGRVVGVTAHRHATRQA